MKKILLVALLCLLSPFANAKVLTSIAILPPSTGYDLPNVSSSAQMTPVCTYDDASTDNCSGQTLTWGTTNTPGMSVTSTGLISWGPSFGDHIVSVARASNVVTVTTSTAFRVPQYSYLIMEGVADSSFNGTFTVQSSTSTSVTYSNSGPDVASSGGKVYFTGGLDVYVYSGSIFAHQIINIDPSVVTAIQVRPESDSTTITQGSTVLVSAEDATIDIQDGAALGDYCAWTSSAPSVASVDTLGNVTGVSAGTAVLTCTLASVTATRTITVVNPTLQNKTWYVGDDGGTVKDAAVPGGQCDGTLDVPLAGSTGGHCRLSTPEYLITDETSSTARTGVMTAGDTAIVHPKADGTPYPMGSKSQNVPWITWSDSSFPSGTPTHPTRVLGSNYAACSSGSAKTKLMNFWSGGFLNFQGVQNLDIECFDVSNWDDCSQGLENSLSFPCPANTANPLGLKGAIPFLADTFTSNLLMKNIYVHGYEYGFAGTPGPGLVMDHFVSKMNYQAGLDFDNPFGYNGNRTEGFHGQNVESSYSGCTEDLPKVVSAVSCDGAGNLQVTFASNQIVNYISGSNIVLADNTPTGFNGTFPVTAITFNQQTVTITGGSCVEEFGGSTSMICSFTTSAPPAFGMGAFVDIEGATPTWLNGKFEVFSTSSSGFVVTASLLTRIGYTHAMILAGGTASTAITLTAASASCSLGTSTINGTATHVIPAHRCQDQHNGGYADGDGVGTGNNTIGNFFCDQCAFIGNLQDGWDMLHSAMIHSTYTNSYSAGNEGAPAKFGNADFGIFQNNIGVANCASFLAFDPNKPPEFNQNLSYPCRGGDGFPINVRPWSIMTISNNTWLSGFNAMMDDSCSDYNGCQYMPTFSQYLLQNNIFVGFQEPNSLSFNDESPGMFCGAGCNASNNLNANWVWNNNIGFNVRNGPDGTNNQWNIDPKFIQSISNIANFAGESTTLSFNVNLQQTSPAIGAGVTNAFSPIMDNSGTERVNPISIGALEYQVGTLLTVTVTPSPSSVIVGNTTGFSAGCVYSTGVTTPCNVAWTDTASHSSVNSVTGVVTGISVGTDTITATMNSVFGTATVTMAPIPPFYLMRGVIFKGGVK